MGVVKEKKRGRGGFWLGVCSEHNLLFFWIEKLGNAGVVNPVLQSRKQRHRK